MPRGGSRPCKQNCTCKRHLVNDRIREIKHLSNIKAWQNPEKRRQFSINNPGRNPSDETRRRMREAWKTRAPVSEETRAKQRAATTKRWAEDDGSWRRAMVRGYRKFGPNKPEKALLTVLSSLNFQYNGDGPLVIFGKVPDFWDGQKRVVEAYGCYWHGCPDCFPKGEKQDDSRERIDLFKQQDYDCLIIWEHELRDMDKVISKISEFVT